jgi:hypothetical protein
LRLREKTRSYGVYFFFVGPREAHYLDGYIRFVIETPYRGTVLKYPLEIRRNGERAICDIADDVDARITEKFKQLDQLTDEELEAQYKGFKRVRYTR